MIVKIKAPAVDCGLREIETEARNLFIATIVTWI